MSTTSKLCMRCNDAPRRTAHHSCLYCTQCQIAVERDWNHRARKKYRAKPAGKEAQRRADRKIVYGLTDLAYQELLRSQQGRCAICRQEGKLQVDHNHVSLKVRGLLCALCNRGIGHFKDKPELLRAALSYLESR